MLDHFISYEYSLSSDDAVVASAGAHSSDFTCNGSTNAPFLLQLFILLLFLWCVLVHTISYQYSSQIDDIFVNTATYRGEMTSQLVPAHA